jgi:Zn-dependent protease
VLPSRQGSFRLFRLAGIDVFLHWSWFVVALIEVRERTGQYSSPVWNVVEYLALFVIVTLHEFGHSLACRQVGGIANQVVLWPLGGVAYVNPPQRPGATLWSIAAGPLVNLALVPVLIGLGLFARQLGLADTMLDVIALLRAVAYINGVLLVFNLLPIYPLDGGQILRSLLWFVIGRSRSLLAASAFGFVGVAALAYLALRAGSAWLGILAAFMGMNCWRGFQHARELWRVERLPRHAGIACPSCGTAPPIGPLWACGACQTPFDVFETHAACPSCHSRFAGVRCSACGTSHAIDDWATTATTSVGWR